MNILKAAVISSLVIVSGFVIAKPAEAATNCDVNPAVTGVSATDLKNKSIVLNGNKVDVSVTVTGDEDCEKTVSIASWKWYTKFGLPLESQKLYKTNTATFGVGTHKLSVNVPDCSWQVDLVEGSRPTAADGTANYQIGEPNDKTDRLMDAAFGGDGICTDTPNKTKRTDKPATETAAPVSVMPSTGSSSIALSALAASTISGLVYSIVQKYAAN